MLHAMLLLLFEVLVVPHTLQGLPVVPLLTQLLQTKQLPFATLPRVTTPLLTVRKRLSLKTSDPLPIGCKDL